MREKSLERSAATHNTKSKQNERISVVGAHPLTRCGGWIDDISMQHTPRRRIATNANATSHAPASRYEVTSKSV